MAFIVWGIDLVGQLLKGAQYAVVVVDYFTKWVETKALASITPTKIKEFVNHNIVCRYGIPHTIVSSNGKQFYYNEFKEFYDKLQIKKYFSSIAGLKLIGGWNL